MSLQKSLEFEDLGPKRIEALEKEAEEWRMKAEDAVASIQDITVNYFAQTSKALAGISCWLFAFISVWSMSLVSFLLGDKFKQSLFCFLLYEKT